MKITVNRKDILWSYGSMLMTMAVNILLLPLYVYSFTAEEIGIWYIFISLGGMALLFDFGFSITFARNITYCWSGAKELCKVGVTYVEQNNTGVNYVLLSQVLQACRRIYILLSGITLILLSTAGSIYIYIISNDLHIYTILTAWFFYSIAIFLNIYYSYYVSFLRGIGAIELANKSIVYGRSIQFFGSIAIILAGGGLIGASIGYLLYTLSFYIFARRYFHGYKNMKVHLEKVKSTINKLEYKKSVKSIFYIVWYNAWRDGLISIANYLSMQATIVLGSLYISLVNIGIYSIAIQLTTAIATIASTLYNTYQPAIQNSYIQKEKEITRSLLFKAIAVFIVIFILGTVGVITIGIPILNFIKPTIQFNKNIFLLVAFMQFLICWRNCYTSYFSCTNRIIYMKSFLTSSIVGLILAWIGLKYTNLEVMSLVISTCFSQLMYNSWYWIVKVNKELNITWIESVFLGFKELSTYKRI